MPGLCQYWFGRRKNHLHRQKLCSQVSEKVILPGLGSVVIKYRISCVGESCPKPQLLTLKVFEESEVGSVIEIITDNVSVVETIPAMMEVFGGHYLATTRDEMGWHLYLCKEQQTVSSLGVKQ
ncbi:MAG: sulfurtransferase TusA family protein [Gammaproteobacteria bacterium]|nr:sulfurtransferase TusA family protein [Gammaproteobacteria bacterium]